MKAIDPVQVVDCYRPNQFSQIDFGIDAEGRNCERKWRRGGFISEGGDSIRDNSAGKFINSGSLVAGEWLVTNEK